MKQDNQVELPALTSAVFKDNSLKEQETAQSKKPVLSTVQTQEKSSETPKTQPSKKSLPTKPMLIDECIELHHVHGTCIFKLNPQLSQHQAIDYLVPSFEVKVGLDDVKEERVLWDAIVGYAKRQLFIHDGFIYSLEKNNTGYFVDSVWTLEDLFQVYYDREDSKFRLVFLEGKLTKNRNFWTKQREPFFKRLQEELTKMGKNMT